LPEVETLLAAAPTAVSEAELSRVPDAEPLHEEQDRTRDSTGAPGTRTSPEFLLPVRHGGMADGAPQDAEFSLLTALPRQDRQVVGPPAEQGRNRESTGHPGTNGLPIPPALLARVA
jgi:hypothetical protein